MNRIIAAALAMLLGVAASAAAQAKPTPPRPAQPSPARPAGPSERIFISINGTYQLAGDDFGEDVTFTEYAETGRFTTDYDLQSGPAFNISAGVNVWRNIAVGVGVSRYSKDTPVEFTASVPHPFFFNRAREVSAEIDDLEREELAVHVQARVMFQPSPKIQGLVFGGPSFFTVKQGIVTDFEIVETYPYDTAAFSRPISTRVDESKVGFNVGADVGYFFTRRVGVGGIVQWSAATIDAPASSGTGTLEIKAGGLQVGGGLRLRF